MDCYQQVWWGLQTNCKILSMTVWPQFFWHAAEWLWVVGTSCHRGTVWRWNQWLKVGAKMSIVPFNRRCFGGFRKIQNQKKCRKKQRSVVLWIVLDVLRITRIKTNPQCRCPEMEWRIWGKVGGTCEVFSRWWQCHQNSAYCGVINGGRARPHISWVQHGWSFWLCTRVAGQTWAEYVSLWVP